MKIHVAAKRIVLLGIVMGPLPEAIGIAHATNTLVEGAMVLAPSEAMMMVASGTMEDTLTACLERIPEVANIGQCRLAEKSCAGEDKVRAAIQSAPKF